MDCVSWLPVLPEPQVLPPGVLPVQPVQEPVLPVQISQPEAALQEPVSPAYQQAAVCCLHPASHWPEQQAVPAV